MERYSSRKLDEMSRIVLPSEVRKKLDLEKGAQLSAILVDTIIVLHKNADVSANTATCEVSDLGMIELRLEFRQKLGLKEKGSIALYHTDNVIILKAVEKS